jgi:Protein of unknown function (DUF2799)
MKTNAKNSFKLLAAAAILAIASGCATMNRKECVNANWDAVGYADGAAGHTADRIGRHLKACAAHGVGVDTTAYQAGREQGLRQYCQPDNGFRIGSKGQIYAGACPVDLRDDFEDAYSSGRELHALRARVDNATNQLRAASGEIEQLEHAIATLSATINDHNVAEPERAKALSDVKQMAERRGELKVEIVQLEVARFHFQRELDKYTASLVGYYRK